MKAKLVNLMIGSFLIRKRFNRNSSILHFTHIFKFECCGAVDPVVLSTGS